MNPAIVEKLTSHFPNIASSLSHIAQNIFQDVLSKLGSSKGV